MTNTLFYLWHCVILQSGNEVEVEAAASAQKYHCPEPNLQGPEFFKTLLPTSKHTKHVPEDRSLNANSRKACYVSLWLILWVQEEIKEYNYSWETCSGPWEQLSFLKSYNFFLHVSEGDLCIFLDLFIGPSFFLMFHTT